MVAAGKAGAAAGAYVSQGWCLRSVQLDQIKTSIQKKSYLKDFNCEIALNEAIFRINIHSFLFVDHLSIQRR